MAPDLALVRVIQVLGQDHRAIPRRVAGALFIFIICTSTSIDRTDALFVSGLNPSCTEFTRSHIPARCSPPRAPRGAAPRSETRPLPNPRENGARAARASSSLLLPPLRSCRQSSCGCSVGGARGGGGGWAGPQSPWGGGRTCWCWVYVRYIQSVNRGAGHIVYPEPTVALFHLSCRGSYNSN